MRASLLLSLATAAACGGGGPAAGTGTTAAAGGGGGDGAAAPAALTNAAASVPIAKASQGVAPPAQPKALVTASPKAVTFSIGSDAPIVMTGDTDPDELVTAVHARLPAAAPCVRGAKPTAAVKYVVARAEPPAPTDAVVLADATRPSTGPHL